MSLDWSLLGPAFLAGLLVTATHVPLGRQVLARGIIFIDLAIAQVAALGVVIAHSLHWAGHGWQVQAVAFCAALVGGCLLAYTERRWPQLQEALIGTLFVLAASAGLLLLATTPHGSERLKELLAGQVLWIQARDLIAVAVLYAGVMALWFGYGRHAQGYVPFYALFALVVTASVQLVGIYLVFASLIIPALAARASHWPWVVGWGVSIGGYALGLMGSAWWDLPAGPLIVLMLAGLALATVLLSRWVATFGSARSS